MLKSIAFYLLPIVLGYLTVIAVNETERLRSDASWGMFLAPTLLLQNAIGHVTTTEATALVNTFTAFPRGSKKWSEVPLNG